MSKISLFILKLFGFSIICDSPYPHHIKKKVIIAGPHTSYWDFPLGVLVRSALKMDANFVGKAPLFKPPLGWIMKPLGGIPIDRSKRNNFVDQIVESYNQEDEMNVCLAPEGTRKKVGKFKTGFYYIAKKANVPILPVIFDFGNKKVILKDLFYPGINAQEDIDKIQALYKGVHGFHPNQSFS